MSRTPATPSPFFSYTFPSGYGTVVRSNIKSKRCYPQFKKKKKLESPSLTTNKRRQCSTDYNCRHLFRWQEQNKVEKQTNKKALTECMLLLLLTQLKKNVT